MSIAPCCNAQVMELYLRSNLVGITVMDTKSDDSTDCTTTTSKEIIWKLLKNFNQSAHLYVLEDVFIYIWNGLSKVSPAFIPKKLPPEKVSLVKLLQGRGKSDFECFSFWCVGHPGRDLGKFTFAEKSFMSKLRCFKDLQIREEEFMTIKNV